ncbi:MAG: hypothetical protein MI724_05920 [Spirochaetales bacterium]|nr:hypothetical protein [Spirochaetales bacterium]
MASVQDMRRILHTYVKHTGNPRVSFEVFMQFAARFAKRYSAGHPDLAPLMTGGASAIVKESLEQLESDGAVQMEKSEDDAIVSLYYPAFYTTEIERWYHTMQENKEASFPSEEHLGVTIPSNVLETIHVADDLMYWLQTPGENPDQILLLKYPDGIRPVVTTVKLLRETMLPLVVGKIRDYLRIDRNGSYMETKLRSIFRGREMLVHEIIETTQVRVDDALKSVTEPSDFQFHFWTQMSSMIIKEYAQKVEKLDMEHAFCQAAYLLGYYSVFQKGRHQKDQKRAATHKMLTELLQKPPYVFTVQDVYQLTDDKGVLLSKLVQRDEINAWLEEMLKRPNEHKISELVSINTTEKEGLMVHSTQYVPLLLRQIKAASPVLQREITAEMTALMLDERKEEWLTDNEAFERALDRRVRDEFFLLHGLCTFQTLFLVIDGQELPAGLRQSAIALIDGNRRKMHGWSEILGLNREALYREARLRLPFWMLIPILRGFVRLLRKMFSTDDRSRKAPRAAAAKTLVSSTKGSSRSGGTAESQREAKRKQFLETLATMQKEYISGDQTAEQRLKELRSQWNPLIDPAASNNLIEDVNALCRDTLRRMRYTRTLQAPDGKRIEELAKRIASSDAFDRIKRRKAFETYLKLYMLTALRRT